MRPILARKDVRLFLGLILLFAFVPFLGIEGYRLRLVSLVFLWIALASCWNFMSGSTGYIDFGPVAYFGAGAYATAILMLRAELSFFPSLILAALVCALLSGLIGFATLRIRGAYFAIATFAAAEALRQIALEGDSLAGFEFFGGSHGLTLPPPPPSEFFYYLLLGFMVLSVGGAILAEKSRFGFGLRAIREAETAAELSGVPTFSLKLKAYIAGSTLIGCLGGIEAYWLTYIIPDDLFSVMRTIQMVVMTLLGGLGSVWGPVIGAAFLTLAGEWLGVKFVYDYLTLLGGVIILVILVLPRGIMSLAKKTGRR